MSSIKYTKISSECPLMSSVSILYSNYTDVSIITMKASLKAMSSIRMNSMWIEYYIWLQRILFLLRITGGELSNMILLLFLGKTSDWTTISILSRSISSMVRVCWLSWERLETSGERWWYWAKGTSSWVTCSSTGLFTKVLQGFAGQPLLLLSYTVFAKEPLWQSKKKSEPLCSTI